MSKIDRWILYGKSTSLGEIARRYFVMNFFDGVLTVLGVIIGNFIIVMNGKVISSQNILVTSISVSIAIGISGISGGYLAEKAERKAELIEIQKSMGYTDVLKLKEKDYYPKKEIPKDQLGMINGEIIEKVQVDPVNLGKKNSW